MSSTNRSNSRDSHLLDYYRTPDKPIVDLFKYIENIPDISHIVTDLNKLSILDPCAGGDLENDMSYPKILNRYGATDITTIDLREDSKSSIKANYLEYTPENKFDLVITNPAFNLAQEIIEKSINDTKDGGYVIMLLRLNFFGSKKRRLFWKDNMPIYTFVHHERICL